MLIPNPTQWSGIVDLTNVSALHDFHDVTAKRPDMDINLTIGEDVFTLEVIPITNAES